MFCTLSILASPPEHHEDMSPEHVVPLDPFLAGGAASIFRSSGISEPMPLKFVAILPYFLIQMASLFYVALALLRYPARLQLCRYSTNLWLLNRVLLI